MRGWSVRNICDRYGLNKAVVKKMLAEWRLRAIGAGYIQDIHPETLETLSRTHEDRADDETREDGLVSRTNLAGEPEFDSQGWVPARPIADNRPTAMPEF